MVLTTATARRRGRPTASDFQPVQIIDVELTRPIDALAGGPARLLVRLHGRPIGFVGVHAPAEGMSPAAVAEVITAAVRDNVPTDLLPEGHNVPADGIVVTAADTRERPAAGISVVVTTCGASRGLVETLHGLENQSLPPQAIFVVDNRPDTSGVAEILASENLPRVRYMAEHRRGISSARNAGLERVTSELVAFTDDDVVVDPDWLAALASGFTAPDVACVTGLVIPLELATPAQCLFEEFGGYSKGFRSRRFDLGAHRGDGALYPFAVGAFGTGANSAFRTKVLRSLGGFVGTLGAGTPALGGEDLDAYLTVIQSGHGLVYQPGAVIRHRHHRDLAGMRRQLHGYGVGISAMLTRRWLTHRAERRQMLSRALAGARYLLHPRSPKNVRKTASYPASLTLVELAGWLRGPVAYWQSRRAA